MKKVLILSCNTGEGHNSCGRALLESFRDKGIPCVMEDTFRFISSSVSRLVSFGFARIYRYLPGVFRIGYQYSENHPGVFKENSGIYKLLTFGAERLYRFIADGEYDTIISTHEMSALIVAEILRRHQTPLCTYFVATDYTCYPGCEQSDSDIYFIPDASLTDEFIRFGIPREKLIFSGIPIRKALYRVLEKAEAKQKIGLTPHCRHLLIMCGSMGCGPIRKLVRELSKSMAESTCISVICGTNHRLKKTLERVYAKETRVKIYGFVNDVSVMMDSADLFLTKPGGISVTEAAQKRLPMAFVNAVAGCESYNMRFYIYKGVAITADSTKALAALISVLLADDVLLKCMAEKYGDWAENTATETVVQTVLNRRVLPGGVV